MINRLKDSSTITIAGHRGYKSSFPENTILAFIKAIEAGADMIEFDLRLSKDQVVMIMHDDLLDRTTNGSGPLSNYTYEELKKLDAGSWFSKEYQGLQIPSLRELCEVMKAYPNILLNVEIKKSATAKKVVDKSVTILKEYGILSRCVFTCFDGEIIAYLHDHYGLKTQGFPEKVMSNFMSEPKGTYSKMWAIAMSMDLLTKDLVKKYREMGLLVWCYCPDDVKEVNYALECGVSLITCNNLGPALSICKNKEL